MAKQTVFTKIDSAVVNALKGAADGLTLSELKETTGMEVKSGNLVGAVKKGLIEVIGERDVTRPGKRKVATYKFVTADALSNDEGKTFNYTDNEKALLEVAAKMEGDFTLAELAAAMNKERLTSFNFQIVSTTKSTALSIPRPTCKPYVSISTDYIFTLNN